MRTEFKIFVFFVVSTSDLHAHRPAWCTNVRIETSQENKNVLSFCNLKRTYNRFNRINALHLFVGVCVVVVHRRCAFRICNRIELSWATKYSAVNHCVPSKFQAKRDIAIATCFVRSRCSLFCRFFFVGSRNAEWAQIKNKSNLNWADRGSSTKFKLKAEIKRNTHTQSKRKINAKQFKWKHGSCENVHHCFCRTLIASRYFHSLSTQCRYVLAMRAFISILIWTNNMKEKKIIKQNETNEMKKKCCAWCLTPFKLIETVNMFCL